MSQIELLLSRLAERELIGDLDRHFAKLLCRLDGGGSSALATIAALTSRAATGGDVCLDLASVVLPGIEGLPASGQWAAELRQSKVVGRPGEFKPLILDAQGRCYLYRYWDYEQRLARALLQRASADLTAIDESLLCQGLERYFPVSEADSSFVDWQKVAAVTALLQRLCVISGGPGTGKTTTVVKILALLLEQYPEGQQPVIALAAPTGKAAARLQESIRGAVQRLQLPEAIQAALPMEAKTLHRMLGTLPNASRFRHDRDNRLPVDMLILDEASMVDLALMVKTVEALPDQARLILLGDRDQLASVEAGAVLGDICGDIPGFSQCFARKVAGLSDIRPETLQGESREELANCLVALRHSYRFERDGGIARLARAVNSGEVAESLVLLQQGSAEGELGWIAAREELIDTLVEGYSGYLTCLRAGGSPEEVLSAFERFKVLCALRVGPHGAVRLNQEIEQVLVVAGVLQTDGQAWYAGRPLMITRNDYNLHLYNGDIGIMMPDAQGDLKACFISSDGRLRWIPPMRLPAHESAYCMTVHKSQGSEFDKVLLVLPELDAAVLTRELLYTAITRAKQRFDLYGPERVLTETVSRRMRRLSGLPDLLWDGAEERTRCVPPADFPGEQLSLDGF
ncbi:MAG: exodeoxyribonuclease V subunit alpha [Chromatiales bacterium]|nr:exodeoxyribonuclease V subunit alpha [Chromatiales bacterium]